MPIQAQPPQPQQTTPYVPTQLEPLRFEQFDGINTTTTRPGVPDEQAYWLDGFMPIAPRNLRVLPDLGTTLFTRTSSNTVIFFEFYNLSGTPYMVVFQSDGSVIQVNVNTQATTTIMAAGGISNPLITNVGVSQWGQQYLLIVAGQANGYWVWDGAVLYTAGTLAPTVTITNAGQGYQSAPVVIISGGSGTGASVVGQIANGVVTGASFISAGSGYLAGDSVVLTFTGGTVTGSGGSVVALMTTSAGGSGATFGAFLSPSSGVWILSSVSVTAHGNGYSQFTAMGISGGSVFSAPIISPVISGGSIVSVTILYSGGYSTNNPGVVSISDPGNTYVSSVSVVAHGTNYSPTTKLTGTGGSTPVVQASYRPAINSGSIASVVVTSGGSYGGTVAPTITITDTASTATATATLMPFGISGTSVETYQGYVWVVSGPILYNSAPGSISDFATSDGGGNKTSTSSKLRIGYTRLIATNGFLYTIADSSIDYISGVQTAGSPISTTYSWLHADPETGTPYPEGAMTYGRGLLLCNAFGIHVMYGSQAQKISEPMDGVYNTVANFGGAQLSVAEQTLFGRKIAIALIPIVDPVSGVSATKLLCWDGKRWFASPQSKTLTYIKHQEINSQIIAYGTDGTVVQPIFTTPSAEFTKTAQTKLWDAPGGYQFDKGASRFWSMARYNSTVSTSIVVSVDSVNNQNVYGSTTYTIAGPSVASLFVFPAQAVGQQGPLMGMTIRTNCPDMQLISAMLQPEEAEYRG
jgi:hypothetical protein